MARKKHSAALFEVITRSRPRSQEASSGLLGIFKARGSASAGSSTSSVALPEAGGEISLAGGLSGRARPAVRVDADRHEVSLHLSFATAIISIFALATVVVGAYLGGRYSAEAPRTMLAVNTTDQLRSGPVQRPLASLRPVSSANSDVADAPSPGDNKAPIVIQSNAAAPPSRPGTRQAGINYVIVQSYPEKEKDLADQAVKVLENNGIACTLERNLGDFANPAWYCVVGLEPFTRITNNPQLDAYVGKIKSISDAHAKGSKFKAFAPQAYKWKKDR